MSKNNGDKTGISETKKRILVAPYGSLGDLHPLLAIAFELRKRGHDVVICTLENYREKIDSLGFEFFPLRPDVDPEDRELAREMMDAWKGTERVVRDLMIANIKPMFDDLMKAAEGADVLISGEIVFAARSVAELKGLKWITTSLAPISLFSAYDPSVFPNLAWMENLRFLGPAAHRGIFSVVKQVIKPWLVPYRVFRSDLGLDPNHTPILSGNSSKLLNLAMFSKVMAKPQPDWHSPTLQTGFCFYDGQMDSGKMPEKLEKFFDEGEPPIVFTLGSAAVMDAGDFFDESIKAAKMLNRRAVMLYGIFNDPPSGLSEAIVGFDYAPFSRIFPRAACVVHQGGVGTTSQVLAAGVPALIIPYSHDQPDNAARCRRIGVAEIITRRNYSAKTVAGSLKKILSDENYLERANEVRKRVMSENGTITACDAIESVIK